MAIDKAKRKFPIKVVGIGPGNPSYLIDAAKKAINQAKILIGGKRALADFSHAGQTTMAITRDIDGVMSFIREHISETEVVVMASGDPGYYSILDALRRNFPSELLQVIPGISSLQLAFARIALPWHDAHLMSFHGRVPEERELFYHSGRTIGMLTDGRYTSRTIPKLLLAHGWPSHSVVYGFSRLSYPDEKMIQTTLGEANEQDEIAHGILIVIGSDEEK